MQENVDLSGIFLFQGYGDLRAPLWFIGIEEGLGGAMNEEEIVYNLQQRAKWSPVRDMYEAHLDLCEGGRPIDISRPRKGSIGVWLWMARMALTLDGQVYEEKPDKYKDYVYNVLGRRDSGTFLTETNPVPCKKKGLLHPLVQNVEYELKVEKRNREIIESIKECDPMIICYGLSHKKQFEKFLGIKWNELHVNDKGSKFYYNPASSAFLIPFLGNGQMSHERIQAFLQTPEVRQAWQRALAH